MTCSLAPHTPVENRAQSELRPSSSRPVASIKYVVSASLRRSPRCERAIINASNSSNTALGRSALASDKVERFASLAPR
jgi:hypothetical protein